MSNIIVKETDAMFQHCIATVTCLLSGLKLVREVRHDNYLTVVKGAHALHVYASEYWVEYLLCTAQLSHGLDDTSKLYTLLDRLCTKMDGICADQHQEDEVAELVHLERYEKIHKLVKQTICARSLRNFEKLLQEESGKSSASFGISARN